MADYVIKYKTGDTGIKISGIIFIIGVLLYGLCAVTGWEETKIASVTISLFSGGALFIFLRSYKEIELYEDHLEVTSLFAGAELEIYFSDINHIGFLKSRVNIGNTYGSTRRRDEIAEDDLIILHRDGAREQLDGSDYDYLPEVYEFIHDRVDISATQSASVFRQR